MSEIDKLYRDAARACDHHPLIPYPPCSRCIKAFGEAVYKAALKDAAEACRQRARTYKACGYVVKTGNTAGAEAIAEECAFFVERLGEPSTPTELMGEEKK